MKKRYAIITDIHGNIEGLSAVMEDIKNKDIDEIFCLGDIINLGPNSKECIDKLIDLNIKSTLGNHELYILRGTDIDTSIEDKEKEHYKWTLNSLSDKEINYLKNCPLYYIIKIDYNNIIPSKEIILCHYLINDENAIYPFERTSLKNDINLWIKYNDPNKIYVIGHLHKHFDINEVDGIKEDFIEETGELTNIEIVDSAGCSYNEYVSYMILEISKSISFKGVNVKFDRNKFINKLKEIDFPDKKNILKYFYGIDD